MKNTLSHSDFSKIFNRPEIPKPISRPHIESVDLLSSAIDTRALLRVVSSKWLDSKDPDNKHRAITQTIISETVEQISNQQIEFVDPVFKTELELLENSTAGIIKDLSTNPDFVDEFGSEVKITPMDAKNTFLGITDTFQNDAIYSVSFFSDHC